MKQLCFFCGELKKVYKIKNGWVCKECGTTTTIPKGEAYIKIVTKEKK